MQRETSVSEGSGHTFESWALNERGFADKTIKDYTVAIRHAQAWMGGRNLLLEQASLADLRTYLFQTRPTARSRNARRCALRAYFEFLVWSGARPENDAQRLPRLPEKRLLPKPLPHQVVPAVLDAAAAMGPRERALVSCALHTGLRLAEIQHLRWSQLGPDVGNDWLILVKKGGDERIVYLHPDLLGALREWRPAAPRSDWVWESSRIPGQPFSKSWIERTVDKVGQAAGIPHVWPHRFRHTFGTRVYRESGRDLLATKRALGHASVKSTEIYAQIEDVDVRRIVQGLNYEGGGER